MAIVSITNIPMQYRIVPASLEIEIRSVGFIVR